jgi:LmbE family N-acetylglucosaminyl deacetylase
MSDPQAPYQRAMVVVAHADDAEYGCSGTVAKWCREGIQVVYVICTDGSKGSDNLTMTSSRLARIRRREQEEAGKVLGLANVVFLDYEDAMLQPTLELRRDISRQIRIYRPDVVITTNPLRTLSGMAYIGHPDHMAAGEATMAAAFPAARDRLTFPELLAEGLEPHKVREIWVQGHETPDLFVDVSETIDVAIQALKMHKSQVNLRNADRRMRQWRAGVNRHHGMKYAEAFKHFHLA